jgi:hypothetical protein
MPKMSFAYEAKPMTRLLFGIETVKKNSRKIPPSRDNNFNDKIAINVRRYPTPMKINLDKLGERSKGNFIAGLSCKSQGLNHGGTFVSFRRDVHARLGIQHDENGFRSSAFRQTLKGLLQKPTTKAIFVVNRS